MRRILSRTASESPIMAAERPRALRATADTAPAQAPPSVTRALDAMAGLAAAISAGGTEIAPARLALAEALLPLALPDMPALSAGLHGLALDTALMPTSLADQARLDTPGEAETALLARRLQDTPGAILAAIAILALPALAEAVFLLALGRAAAARLLAAELDLLAAGDAAAQPARDRLVQALAALPREIRDALACPLTITRTGLARAPWRPELAGLVAPAAPAAGLAGAATAFCHGIRITLAEALPMGVTHGFAFRAEPALPAADWTILADGVPLLAWSVMQGGIVEVAFASMVPLPAGTVITAEPPAGEYFRHYTAIAGVHGPLRSLGGPLPPLRITALSEPCLDGFHKPEHLPGAIGRWMGQHGRIRLPSCPTPLRATLRGRHRQVLIAAGGLLAAVGDTPLDLVFETLGKPHDAGEWLIHLHLPPTTPPGHGWLRLSLPELPPRSTVETRDIGLIFLGMEVAPIPGGAHRFGTAG